MVNGFIRFFLAQVARVGEVVRIWRFSEGGAMGFRTF